MEIVAAAIDDGVKGCEEEDEGEGFKHFCKVCKRGFACWRALGGHMRIHKADKKKRKKRVNESVGSCEEEVGRLNSMYTLRRNPKRSWRFVDDEDHSFMTGEADRCKGFGSAGAAYQEVFSANDHIHKEINGGQHQLETSKQNWENSKQNPMHKLEATSHGRSESETDNVGTDVASSGPNENQQSFHRWMKGKRSKRPRSGHNRPLDSEQQQEEEDMANCLIMLATGCGCEAKDYVVTEAAAFSVTSGSATFKLPSIEREEEDDVSELEVSSTTRGKPKEPRDGVMKKRNKYQCKTCGKTFETYQGLGGHRASHKRVKGCFARNAVPREADAFQEDEQILSIAKQDDREEEMLEFGGDGCHKLPKVHECCICLRTFASGQALGGHKRCHLLVSETCTTTSFTSTKHQNLLDLTMPTSIREQVDPDDTKMSSPALGRTFMHSLRSPAREGDEMRADKEDEAESKLESEIGPTVDNTLDLIQHGCRPCLQV